MGRRRPECGDTSAVHGPHGFWTGMFSASWLACRGWSAADSDARALMDVLDGYCREHAGIMPAGIRLECHPYVPHVLTGFMIPDYGEFASGLATGSLPLPQVPVIVSADMGHGAWRLAQGENGGHLIAEGVIR